jgi:hypothetical protein
MGVSASCSLFIGFDVHFSDLYLKSRDQAATCEKGHPRPDIESKFCSKDGSKFSFKDTTGPTPLLLAIFQRYEWKLPKEDCDWEDEVQNYIEADAGPLFRIQDYSNLIFGVKIKRIGSYDNYKASSHEMVKLQDEAVKLRQLRDELGFPGDRPIEISMSLYFG